MKAENYADCRAHIEKMHGVISNTSTSDAVASLEKKKSVQMAQATKPVDKTLAKTPTAVSRPVNNTVSTSPLPANGSQQKSLMKWDAAKGGWVPNDSGAETPGS